jgi:hypothetical protein
VAFDDDHSAASLAKERGEHAADRPAADDGDVARVHVVTVALINRSGKARQL